MAKMPAKILSSPFVVELFLRENGNTWRNLFLLALSFSLAFSSMTFRPHRLSFEMHLAVHQFLEKVQADQEQDKLL